MCPLRIPAVRGQVPRDPGQVRVVSELDAGDVLQEEVVASHFAQEFPSGGPEIAGVLFSLQSTSKGETWTWDAGNHKIHETTEGSRIEGE
jgi:hypothetical protein